MPALLDSSSHECCVTPGRLVVLVGSVPCARVKA